MKDGQRRECLLEPFLSGSFSAKNHIFYTAFIPDSFSLKWGEKWECFPNFYNFKKLMKKLVLRGVSTFQPPWLHFVK